MCKHLREVRSSQSCHRIPTFHSLEAWSPAPLITSTSNIIHHTRMRIQSWVDESNRALPNRQSGRVDQCYHASKCRRAGTGTEYIAEIAVHSNDVVDAVGRDIWVATGHLRCVVAVGAV